MNFRIQVVAVLAVALALFLGMPGLVSGQTWTATNIYNNWTSVAMTSDGTKIVADAFIGGIYTSTNSGTNWQYNVAPDQNHWSVLTTSTNGGNLAAAYFGGGIYISTNWASSWNASKAQNDNWNCLASSADGSKMAAGTFGGPIYTSKDSGNSFTCKLPKDTSYQSIAGSADGKYLMAVVFGDFDGRIYHSTDFGESWAVASAPFSYWAGVAVSTNGASATAIVQGGGIYYSLDYGNTWNISSAPVTNWSAVSCSSDGNLVVATVNGGLVYVSHDSGKDWFATSANSNNWSGAYISPDGTWFTALTRSNSIGTSFTNIIYNDTLSMVAVCTNINNGTLTTNIYTTTFPISDSTIVPNSATITNTLGFYLLGATLTNYNAVVISPVVGVGIQNNQAIGITNTTSNQFGFISFGTNVFGTGLVVSSYGATNTVISTILTLNSNGGAGGFISNVVNVLNTNFTGIQLLITNTVKMELVVEKTGSQQNQSALAGSGDGRLLITAVSGGLIYYSTNMGSYWYSPTNLVQYWGSIAASGTGSKLVAAVINGGIFSSTDAGVTWVSNNVPSQDWSAVYSSSDGNLLVALSRTGWSYKSTNAGLSWVEMSAPSGDCVSVASSADGNRLLASFDHVYMSTNAGLTWNQVVIVPNSTNTIVSSDIVFFTQSYSNIITQTNVNNLVFTNYTYPKLSNSSNVLAVSSTVSLNAYSTNGLDIATVSMGANIQGSNLFGYANVFSNSINTNVVGKSYPNLLIQSAQNYNVSFDPTGPLNTNGAFTTNIINNISTNIAGVQMAFGSQITASVVVADTRNNWSPVASSADGSHLAAAISGGLIYVSTNFGAHWFACNAPTNNWCFIVMSADGTRMTAAAKGDLLYSSTNSGLNWVAANVPASNWASVATSADGAELVAVVDRGVLYSSQQVGTVTSHISSTSLKIRMASGNVILSWPVGATNVVLQQNSIDAMSSWADLPTSPIVTNSENQVVLPLSTTHCMFRLKQQ